MLAVIDSLRRGRLSSGLVGRLLLVVVRPARMLHHTALRPAVSGRLPCCWETQDTSYTSGQARAEQWDLQVAC
jgi:hypothetical protein